MNYQRIYDAIVAKRKLVGVVGYSEEHHILPRCLGGGDTDNNLVSLSAREHFLCHLLLTKIHSTGIAHEKMIYAFLMMFVSSKKNQRHSPSRQYALLREQFSTMQSVRNIGAGNSQFGTVWVHDPVTLKAMKVARDAIPEGVVLGRVPKVVGVSKKKSANVEKYTAWYSIYKEVGFEEFVRQTGYQFSKENLVQQFARHVESFEPQNGKRRGSVPL